MIRKFAFIWLALALAQVSVASAKEGDASFSVSPDSAYDLLVGAINGAKTSIDMNVYMFTHKYIAKALVAKAQQGVKIRVLVEGEPNGGTVFPAVKQTLDDLNAAFLEKAPNNAKLLIMTGNGDKSKRRYVFNHAKYAVIDGKKVFVSSDNFTGSAFPDPSRTVYAGGSRGWQVTLDNQKIAKELSAIFEIDQAGPNDVVPYAQAKIIVSDPNAGSPLPEREPRTAKSFGVGSGLAGKATLCASPKSLSCVVDFIRSAKTEISVEHLSLPLYWNDWTKPNSANQPNPIVNELLAAAKRGVKVKVLVNDDKTFGDKDGDNSSGEKMKNSYLVTWLQKTAADGKLPLEAALFDAKATQTAYVHNKGMVADKSRIFVSSINGTQNSVENNREVAVAVDTEDGAQYFNMVFDFDWQNRQQ